MVVLSSLSSLTESLRCALDETFKVTYFIDERIHVGNYGDRRRREVAKILRNSKTPFLRFDTELVGHMDSVELALLVFRGTYRRAPENHLITEMKIVKDFVLDREYASVEELCLYVDQVFADMLHWFLTQLPRSVLKEVNESPVEEYEERARLVLKLLHKLDPSLEDKVQWSFPSGANITRLFDPLEHHEEGNQRDFAVEDVGATTTTADIIPSTQDVELGSI
ncbi:hypothetical protein Sjap_008944 [Stephania japonica]|uniref:Uncharacterized protein n=1 Tax=Stephania japonica TaxID=461633 RepID=A0AAP0JRC9_9MAGN